MELLEAKGLSGGLVSFCPSPAPVGHSSLPSMPLEREPEENPKRRGGPPGPQKALDFIDLFARQLLVHQPPTTPP